MDYVCPVDELEQRLKDAGEQLAFPPASTKDLLHLLDTTEQLLTYVGQAPSISMQAALVHSMGALIADGLLKHCDIDVRVSVASCLCEVARITAPEPPYKDEHMKEIFQLNVLAVGKLSNVTSQCYHKAVHILESVAKVKSCLLILDLKCDALVLEMFEQFLSEIRVTHPHEVFSDMETIMTLLIKESDEIATDLLSLLISHVKKEKQIAAPASWKLADNVLRNCNDTLKFYSETITKLVNSNLDDYAEVVTALCQSSNLTRSTRSTRTNSNSTHKRYFNTLENGGSTKKQKCADENRLNRKEIESSGRGRPKKNKNSLNKDSSPDSVQNSQEDMRRTRFQNKKQSSSTNGNVENSGSLYNVVIMKEDETIPDYDGAEPLTQENNNNKNIQKRRKPSSNTRVANGSRGKGITKKWGQDLVGHRIKVWWPLDKMYYEGAVSSYNPTDHKHKVLYADGDEELLDLHNEKWIILDETSPSRQQEQVTPAKRRKQKGNRKLDSTLKQQDNSFSSKSPPPADSSKTADVICNDDDNKESDPALTPATSCGLKLTETAIDDVEADGDPNPNGNSQEKKPSESSEITQRLENTDNLVCES